MPLYRDNSSKMQKLLLRFSRCTPAVCQSYIDYSPDLKSRRLLGVVPQRDSNPIVEHLLVFTGYYYLVGAVKDPITRFEMLALNTTCIALIF